MPLLRTSSTGLTCTTPPQRMCRPAKRTSIASWSRCWPWSSAAAARSSRQTRSPHTLVHSQELPVSSWHFIAADCSAVWLCRCGTCVSDSRQLAYRANQNLVPRLPVCAPRARRAERCLRRRRTGGGRRSASQRQQRQRCGRPTEH